MSENERMDRAERIRRMREGRRGNGAGDDAEEADEEQSNETPDASATDEMEQADDASIESGGPASASTATTNGPPAETGDGDADSGDADVLDAEEPATDEAATTADEAAADEAAADEAAAADAEVDDVVADAVERISGASASIPDTGEGEDGTEESDADAEAEAEADQQEGEEDSPAESAEPTAESETESESSDQTRVLEFMLDDEQYCLDIAYIEEIVKHEHITRVPNTPAFVEGVVDMRGQITTILNPKIPIEKEDTEPGKLIVVFDAEAFDEQGHLGWVVDDVRQVSPVTDAEVNHPPMDEDYINGIIDRDADDEFVIWTTPDLALDEAA